MIRSRAVIATQCNAKYVPQRLVALVPPKADKARETKGVRVGLDNKQVLPVVPLRYAGKPRQELAALRRKMLDQIEEMEGRRDGFDTNLYDDCVKVLSEVDEALLAIAYDPLGLEMCMQEEFMDEPECRTFDV